jgi:hypothetical protein
MLELACSRTVIKTSPWRHPTDALALHNAGLETHKVPLSAEKATQSRYVRHFQGDTTASLTKSSREVLNQTENEKSASFDTHSKDGVGREREKCPIKAHRAARRARRTQLCLLPPLCNTINPHHL